MTGLMTLRSEWEEQGRPGDFNLYENARMTEMFDEMGGRIRSLDGAERAETEQALVDSFNLYFSKFETGELKAETLEEVEAAFGEETDFGATINANTVMFEFGASSLSSAKPIASPRQPLPSLPSRSWIISTGLSRVCGS